MHGVLTWRWRWCNKILLHRMNDRLGRGACRWSKDRRETCVKRGNIWKWATDPERGVWVKSITAGGGSGKKQEKKTYQLSTCWKQSLSNKSKMQSRSVCGVQITKIIVIPGTWKPGDISRREDVRVNALTTVDFVIHTVHGTVTASAACDALSAAALELVCCTRRAGAGARVALQRGDALQCLKYHLISVVFAHETTSNALHFLSVDWTLSRHLTKLNRDSMRNTNLSVVDKQELLSFILLLLLNYKSEKSWASKSALVY